MTAHVKITENPAVPVTFAVTTAADTFAFSFPAWIKRDLHVFVDGEKLSASAWDVTFTDIQESIPVVGGYAGGVITLVDAVSSCTLTIDRLVTFDRDTDLPDAGGFNMKALNSDLDRITARDQDMKRWLERTVTVPLGETGFELDPLAERAGVGPLMFDSAGKFTEYAGALPGSVAVSAYMATLLASASLAAFRANTGIFGVCYLDARFGGVDDPDLDQVVQAQACMDYCASIAHIVNGQRVRVAMDLGGTVLKVVAGPLIGKSGVWVQNGTIDFSEVALSSSDYSPYYAGYAAEGTLTETLASLTERTVKGSQGCVIGDDGDFTDGDLVMIGHSPPQTLANGAIGSTGHTLNVDSTAGFPNSGILLLASEFVAYTSKTATAFNIRSSPEGRGRLFTSATAWPDNARVTLFHAGWYWLSGSTQRIPAEINYIEDGPRFLESGKRSLLMRHAFDRIFSPSQSAWIKRIDAVKNIGLRNVTFIGSTSQGRLGGVEVGYMLRYVDGFSVEGCDVRLCADEHGRIDSCFNGSIQQTMLGKADSSEHDGHYGVSIINCCTWIKVRDCIGRNIFKLVTLWASGLSSNPNSQAWYGVPRHIECSDNRIFNAGSPWDNAHGLYECHSPVQHARFSGASGSDGAEVISFEGGEDITVDGGMAGRWTRQAIGMDNAYQMRGLRVRNLVIGDRTLLAAATHLTADINDTQTTLQVDDPEWITDLDNDYTAELIQIDDEKIKLSHHSTDGNFDNCERGYAGTTAAAHTAGARIHALGSAFATPIDLILGPCQALLVDPDKYAAYLTGGGINDTDVTVGVSDLSQFDAPTATLPCFAWVEGASDEPEIISYTGKSAATGAGNLTGCERGRKGTTAASHAANLLIQQYVPAITDIDISNIDCTSDIPRALISIAGFNPSENCRLSGIGLTWTGTDRMYTYAVVLQPHQWAVHGGGKTLTGLPYGYRLQGNEQSADGLRGVLASTDTTGGTLFAIEGDRTIVDGCKAWRYNLVGYIQTGAIGSVVKNCTGHEINSGTDGIEDNGTSSDVAIGNSVVA